MAAQHVWNTVHDYNKTGFIRYLGSRVRLPYQPRTAHFACVHLGGNTLRDAPSNCISGIPSLSPALLSTSWMRRLKNEEVSVLLIDGNDGFAQSELRRLVRAAQEAKLPTVVLADPHSALTTVSSTAFSLSVGAPETFQNRRSSLQSTISQIKRLRSPRLAVHAALTLHSIKFLESFFSAFESVACAFYFTACYETKGPAAQDISTALLRLKQRHPILNLTSHLRRGHLAAGSDASQKSLLSYQIRRSPSHRPSVLPAVPGNKLSALPAVLTPFNVEAWLNLNRLLLGIL